MTTAVAERPLQIATIEGTRKDLGLLEPEAIAQQSLVRVDEKTRKAAEDFGGKLLAVDEKGRFALSQNPKLRTAARTSVEEAGMNISREGEAKSAVLKQSIAKLAQVGMEGSQVAKDLVSLNDQVTNLDPQRYDFQPGAIAAFFGIVRPIQRRIRRYFLKYQAADTVINGMLRSLDNGVLQLQRDNQMYVDDQMTAFELMERYKKLIAVLQESDRLIEAKLAGMSPEEDVEEYRFIQEEILFPLRQRLQDTLQELGVRQIEVVSLEVLRRNNRELIRGAVRVRRVTLVALQTAVKLALGLANQRLVLRAIQLMTGTTEKIMAGVAAQLEEQGVEVHQQAAGTALNMKSFQETFGRTLSAFEQVLAFRREALPVLAETIKALEDTTAQGDQAIQRIKKGQAQAPLIELEVAA